MWSGVLTLSRFSHLWLVLVQVLSTNHLLCNGLYIDPYLEEVHDNHYFEPRKLFFNSEDQQVYLNPIGSKLLQGQDMLVQEGSNRIEIRVRPPEGFLKKEITFEMEVGDRTIVRTVSSVSSKINAAGKKDVFKKPFISLDMPEEDHNDIKKEKKKKNKKKKNFIIKKETYDKPVVIMKELAKPTKEAFIKNHINQYNDEEEEGVVVSIKKKTQPDNSNVYIIKKKRKILTSGGSTPIKKILTSTPKITTQRYSLTTEKTKKQRPRMDPRPRSTSSSSTTSTTSTTSRSTPQVSTRSTPQLLLEQNYSELPYLPTPVPLVKTSQDYGIFPSFPSLEILKNKNASDNDDTTDQDTIEDITNEIFVAEETTIREHMMPTPLPLVGLENFFGIYQSVPLEVKKLATTKDDSIKDDAKEPRSLFNTDEDIGGEAQEKQAMDDSEHKSRSLRLFPRKKHGPRRRKPPQVFQAIPIQPKKIHSRQQVHPHPAIVVNPVTFKHKNVVPSKLRLYYRKRHPKPHPPQIVHQQIPPPPPPPQVGSVTLKLEGYDDTYKAFESAKTSNIIINKPVFIPSPSFDDKPLESTRQVRQSYQNKESFQDAKVEPSIPQFPQHPSFYYNFNSEFGTKLAIPKTESEEFVTRRTVPVKTQPFVVHDDNKWHPVIVTTKSPIFAPEKAKTPFHSGLNQRQKVQNLDKATKNALNDFITIKDDNAGGLGVGNLLVSDPYTNEDLIEDIGKLEAVRIPAAASDFVNVGPTYKRQVSYAPGPPYRPADHQGSYFNKDFFQERSFDQSLNKRSRKLELPAIKSDNFPQVLRHISTYGRSLSLRDDLVDFGGASGNNGAFGWYSDHPVGGSEGFLG
jgi:hypothetical protein